MTMWRKAGIVIQTAIVVLGVIPPSSPAAAQNTSTVSLAEQLEAQYQLVKLGPDANGTKVLEPGTVLTIQKDGIFGVPHRSAAVCASRYQDSKVDSPETLCPAAIKKDSRPFKVGDKVYPSQIRADLKNDQISFGIIACDACNGTDPPSSFRSEVIFKFAKGYLANASVPEVEDTIAEVFAVDNSAAQAPPSAPSEAEEMGSNVLTNDMVIKMAGAKLGDAVILAKMKGSQCSFDTSTDALIKLKQAGVSDAVLQAMIGAAAAPAPELAPAQPAEPSVGEAPAAQPPPPVAPDCGDFNSCLTNGNSALRDANWAQARVDFQAASTMDASKPEAWAGQGFADLPLDRGNNLPLSWDNALARGGTIVIDVWHHSGMHFERGVFRLSAKNISFVGPGQKTAFSVSPAQVSSVKAARIAWTGSWAFLMKVDGKNYHFYYVPLGFVCDLPISPSCRGSEASNQMITVANYVAQTIEKLAAGNSAK
jgi:hypothetical protein